MSTFNDLAQSALSKLEDSGVFWNTQNEIYPLVLESLCEATLLCGEPEIRNSSTPFTIPANTTFLSNPAGAFAVLRVELNGLPLHKVSVFDLDMDNQAWQNDPAVNVPTDWFPLGYGSWGIHPQVKAPVQAILTVVGYPVTDTPPYTGNETILLPPEYNVGLEAYASGWARLKEGDPEASIGVSQYEVFLSCMEELSKLSLRKGSLRFSRTMGSDPGVYPVEKK